jgi:hypothetical protein
MMPMAKNRLTPKWGNFAAWSVTAAVCYAFAMAAMSSLLSKNGVEAIFRSPAVAAEVGLCLVASIVVAGFTNGKRPFSLRNVRNFLVWNAVAIVFFLLVVWGFSAFARAGAGGSEWGAAIAGATLILGALLGILAVTSAHTGAHLIDDQAGAEELRERARMYLYSFVWMACSGLLLIVLSLAGRGGVLAPTAALAVALALIALLAVLGIAAWRLCDELARTLSYETGNMAFYLTLVLGGCWAMLAHLGFVAGPAPIDLLTMFIVLLFAAGFIAAGRRRLLTR